MKYTFHIYVYIFVVWRLSPGSCSQTFYPWATPYPTFLFVFLKKIYLFYVYECSICMYTCVPEEGIGSHYRWLWATMWLLGIELMTSGRARSALNHWVLVSGLAPNPLTIHLGDSDLHTCCQGNRHHIARIHLAHFPPLPAATSLSK